MMSIGVGMNGLDVSVKSGACMGIVYGAVDE